MLVEHATAGAVSWRIPCIEERAKLLVNRGHVVGRPPVLPPDRVREEAHAVLQPHVVAIQVIAGSGVLILFSSSADAESLRQEPLACFIAPYEWNVGS